MLLQLKTCVVAVFVITFFVLLSKLQLKIQPFKSTNFTPLLLSGDYSYRCLQHLGTARFGHIFPVCYRGFSEQSTIISLNELK